jgi:hypothetical protein
MLARTSHCSEISSCRWLQGIIPSLLKLEDSVFPLADPHSGQGGLEHATSCGREHEAGIATGSVSKERTLAWGSSSQVNRVYVLEEVEAGEAPYLS